MSWEFYVLMIPALLILGLTSLIVFLAPFALWAAIVIGGVLGIRWIVFDAIRLANLPPASKPATNGEDHGQDDQRRPA